MKKFNFLVGMAMLAASGAVLAQPSEDPRRDGEGVTRQQVIERNMQRFDRLDIDDDGRITRAEVQQARTQWREHRAGRAFDRLDLDDNGVIARGEFERARAELREQRGERRAERSESRRGRYAGRARRAGGFGGERLFGEQGVITREQFRDRALERFDRLDHDRDGVVTFAERRQSLEERRQRRIDRSN